ncbi:unnamed protein product, partial [Rotaria sp. Silwood2]
MKFRTIIQLLYKKALDYNVFIPEDENDNNADRTEDLETVVIHQRYATRLYILLFI